MTKTAKISVAGRTLTLEAAGGDALKAALLRYLDDPVARSLEHHDRLVLITRNAESFVDADGLLHVGAWLLDPGDGEPTLTYPVTGGAGASRDLYVARLRLVRDEWWVTSIGLQTVTGR